MPIFGSLIPFWSFLKSVLIFHHWDFYGTDSIHEKSDGHNLIFQVQMFVMCKEKERTLYEVEITLWPNRVSAVFNRAEWKKMTDRTLRSYPQCGTVYWVHKCVWSAKEVPFD